MITAVAIDDESLSLEMISDLCLQNKAISLVKSFNNTSAAQTYLQQQSADLLFLDIHIHDVNGIDFYRQLSKDMMVIFTTAHSQYAVEGFNINAIDYLLKPITVERFNKAIGKAIDFNNYRQHKQLGSKCIYVRSEYQLVKVMLDEVIYIEGLQDYVRIHLTGKKPILTLSTMKDFLSKLPVEEFVRVHRSFIVPLSKIERLQNKKLKIGDKLVPIGESFRKNIEDIKAK